MSFLPKYRVIFYDYAVKWCSGVYCNWCVSLDISEMLFLKRLFCYPGFSAWESCKLPSPLNIP